MKHTTQMIKSAKSAAAFFLLIFALASCASTKSQSASADNDAFYSENAKDFYTETLENGIPVYFKKTNGKVAVVRMIIEGGTPLLPIEKSGLEDVTMRLMLHGSKDWSYSQIQQLEFETGFSLSSSASKDYSIIGFKCLIGDIDTVLAVFSDAIFNPLMNQADFDKIMMICAEQVQREESDPSSQLTEVFHQAAYKNHAYASSASVTKESLSNITLNDALECKEKMLNAARIKFVAVGNFDDAARASFLEQLSSLFSSLTAQADWQPPKVEKITVAGEDISVFNAQAGDSAYSIWWFNCPSRYDSDYIPFALASMFLDDLLFSIVREQNGAVYSIGTGVLTGKEMLGAISAYKISDAENIDALIKQSLSSFPQKAEVKRQLDRYKNKYITTLFSNSGTTAQTASSMITSLEYSGEIDTYLHRSSQVEAVNADQVMLAYKHYFAPLLSSPASYSKIIVSSKPSAASRQSED